MINILIVDDHELVRKGLRQILENVDDFNIIDDLSSGEEAVAYCRKQAPNVILMDVNMPGIGGLQATKQIRRVCEEAKIICLSMLTENPIPAKAMQAGAHGFITKVAQVDEMVMAIRKVHSGQIYITPEIAQQIAISKLNMIADNPFDSLSERELEIALLVIKGAKVPDIAETLNISAKTVNTYRYRLFEKLEIHSDVELTHLAYKYKLLTPDQI